LNIETFVARGLQIALALGGAYLIATWFVLAIWTFRDIESRSRSVISQVFSTLLVVLFWVPGWLLYRLLRPNETLDEAYQRSLEEEYLLQDLQEMPLCPSCNHYVEDEWQLCPHCNTQLREDCDNCGRLIDLRWDICPYCGAQHNLEQADIDVTVDDDRWIDPASIEKRLRDEDKRRTREETRALPAATAATTLGRDLLSPSVLRMDEFRTSSTAEPNGSVADRRRDSDQNVASPEPGASPSRTRGEPDLSVLRDPGEEEDEHDTDDTTVPDRFKIQ
jgi:RNA polymerase subunit RPABC4/transcription elongation factor Spt4